PIVAPIAAVVAAASTGFAPLLWWLVGPAVIAATLAVIARRLRIERDRIQAEDPAAGSEVFTLRGVVRQVRAAFLRCRAFVRWHRRAFVVVAAVGGFIATVASLLVIQRSTDATADSPAAAAIAPPALAMTLGSNPNSHSTYRIDPAICEEESELARRC